MDQNQILLHQLSQQMLPEIEETLTQVVARVDGNEFGELHTMLAYHLGWEGEGAGPQARGKRIRPLLLLLTSAAAGGVWRNALPAAAAVELVHNFSLIHDDIEDNSPMRRGRPSVWYVWGIPQAINAGDAMFTLAYLSMFQLEEVASPAIALQGLRILHETCLHLTQGQFLDIAYESRGNLTLESYWPMVSGKTAALFATCMELGALVADSSPGIRQSYQQFGRALGLAFQAQDDLLGIWGDAELTGKSAESDLLTGKKTLPILYGLDQRGKFYQRWKQGPIQPQEVEELAEQLINEGAYQYTQEITDQLTQQALQALQEANPRGDPGEALKILANRLLKRQG